MEAEPERGGNYFVLGTIVGAALGVAMALLFAPQPGEQTRAVLKEKGIELHHRARRVQPAVSEPGPESFKDDCLRAEEATGDIQQESHQEGRR